MAGGQIAGIPEQLFAVHKLNEQGMAKARNLASDFEFLLAKICEYVPAGRELAIVKTKLEEAAFFAKKGMAMQPNNQERS